MITRRQGGSQVKGAPLHIVRKADFVLQPDADGGWKITAYTWSCTRDGAGLSRPRRPAAASTETGNDRRRPRPAARRPTVLCRLLRSRAVSPRRGWRWVCPSRPQGHGVVPGRRSSAPPATRRTAAAVLRARGRHGARSDDPAQSPDDPGLADAIHVIGVNPALRVGHDHRHPARHRPRRREDQLVHREHPGGRCALGRRGHRSVVGVPITRSIRATSRVPADGRRDRWHRRQRPHRRWTTTSPARLRSRPRNLNGQQALPFSRNRHQFPQQRPHPHENQGS